MHSSKCTQMRARVEKVTVLGWNKSLEDTDKHIEVADGHHVMAKQKGQVQIKMCNNRRNTFIVTFKNVLLAPDICDRIFLIIM